MRGSNWIDPSLRQPPYPREISVKISNNRTGRRETITATNSNSVIGRNSGRIGFMPLPNELALNQHKQHDCGYNARRIKFMPLESHSEQNEYNLIPPVIGENRGRFGFMPLPKVLVRNQNSQH